MASATKYCYPILAEEMVKAYLEDATAGRFYAALYLETTSVAFTVQAVQDSATVSALKGALGGTPEPGVVGERVDLTDLEVTRTGDAVKWRGSLTDFGSPVGGGGDPQVGHVVIVRRAVAGTDNDAADIPMCVIGIQPRAADGSAFPFQLENQSGTPAVGDLATINAGS